MEKYKTTHKLAAAFTAGILMSECTSASAAATDLTVLSNNIAASGAGLPHMISTVAYVGGIGLGVAGIFKLKQHVDNPGQAPLKDGLIRLGAGGGLLALPFITSAMQGSINEGDTNQATQTPFLAPQ